MTYIGVLNTTATPADAITTRENTSMMKTSGAKIGVRINVIMKFFKMFSFKLLEVHTHRYQTEYA